MGALGTLNQTCGIKIGNMILNGRQVAIVVIEDARFGKDKHGDTTLAHVIDGMSEILKENEENNDATTKQAPCDLVLPGSFNQTTSISREAS